MFSPALVFVAASGPLVDWETAALGLGSALALLRYRVNSAWLVVLGSLFGALVKA